MAMRKKRTVLAFQHHIIDYAYLFQYKSKLLCQLNPTVPMHEITLLTNNSDTSCYLINMNISDGVLF